MDKKSTILEIEIFLSQYLDIGISIGYKQVDLILDENDVLVGFDIKTDSDINRSDIQLIEGEFDCILTTIEQTFRNEIMLEFSFLNQEDDIVYDKEEIEEEISEITENILELREDLIENEDVIDALDYELDEMYPTVNFGEYTFKPSYVFKRCCGKEYDLRLKEFVEELTESGREELFIKELGDLTERLQELENRKRGLKHV